MAVRDPKKSARWWIKNFGFEKAFAFDGGVAIENDAITIVLKKGVPRPSTIGWELSVQNAVRPRK